MNVLQCFKCMAWMWWDGEDVRNKLYLGYRKDTMNKIDLSAAREGDSQPFESMSIIIMGLGPGSGCILDSCVLCSASQ